MDVEKLKKNIQEVIEPLQYKVYVGPFSNYNTKKEIHDRTLVIEPIDVPLTRPGRCDYDLSLTFNMGIRRGVDQKFVDSEDDVAFINQLVTEASEFFQLLHTSPRFTVKENPERIRGTYFESTSTRTVNSQAFLRFTVPLKTYGI